MNTVQYLTKMIQELQSAAEFISAEEAKSLASEILKAKKIFVAGAGRSGFMGRAFVMRMMHMGFDAHIVGETTTPTFEKDDLLIIGTGSGETGTLVPIVRKAKTIGGRVAVVTLSTNSTIGLLSDIVVKLSGQVKDKSNADFKTIQPMGSLFEQTMLLFYDATILAIMEQKGLDSNKMYGNHANLE